MSSTLGTYYIDIVPSTDGISGELEQAVGGNATQIGTDAGVDIASSIKKALVGAGIGIAVKKAFDGIGNVASYGDDIDKTSQKLGISSKAYQEWDAVLKHSGSSISALKPAMKQLDKSAIANSKSFEKLGISQKDLSKMSSEELFDATITGLQNVQDESDRTEIASDLLGRSYQELGPLLNTSAEDTQAMKDRVNELGGVMSDDAVKASARYQDSLQDMQTGFDSLGRNIATQFLPACADVMDGITEIFAGDASSGIGLILQGLGGFGSKVVEIIPQAVQGIITLGQSLIVELGKQMPTFLQKGGELVLNLVNGLVAKIPTFINNLGTLISNGITYLSQHYHEFLAKGMEFVGRMAMGIIQNLPAIVTAIMNVITKVLTTIVSNLPQFLANGIKFVVYLAKGIIQSMPKILSAAAKIVTTIITKVATLPGKLFNSATKAISQFVKGFSVKKVTTAVGKVVSGVVTAISKLPGKVWSAVKSIPSKLASAFKFTLPKIKLPHFSLEGKFSLTKMTVPTVSIKWYKSGGYFEDDTVLSNGIGIGDSEGGEYALPLNERSLTPLARMLNKLQSEEGTNNLNQAVTINVYASNGMDVNDLANKVERKLINSQNRRRLAWR